MIELLLQMLHLGDTGLRDIVDALCSMMNASAAFRSLAVALSRQFSRYQVFSASIMIPESGTFDFL